MGEAGGGIPIDGGDDEPAEDDARRSGKVGGADGRPLGRRPSCHATQSWSRKKTMKSTPTSKLRREVGGRWATQSQSVIE